MTGVDPADREFAAIVAELVLDLISPGGDPTCDGYVPRVGEHVLCVRVTDDETRCGTVDDNRCGLFLTCCDGRKRVLTAARWYVRETDTCVDLGMAE